MAIRNVVDLKRYCDRLLEPLALPQATQQALVVAIISLVCEEMRAAVEHVRAEQSRPVETTKALLRLAPDTLCASGKAS